MATEFLADDKVKEVAEAFALDAVDDALRNMAVCLDWSEASIERVEVILDRLYKQAQTRTPSLRLVWTVAKVFGSYIGQVFILHDGGTWGTTTVGGDRLATVRAAKDGTLFWPWMRAMKRLTNGPEENVWHYYLHLTSKLQRRSGPIHCAGSAVD